VQVELEYEITFQVYSVRRGPMSSLGTVVYPRSHLCNSLRQRKLGCQRASSHQASTIDCRVDHNEKGIKPETYQGYRKKVFWKMTEDLERIQDPRSSVANAINGILR
jgi:hypothetical protein